VSKDADFQQRSISLGAPPKVIGIALGNSSTTEVAAVLREHYTSIRRFIENSGGSFLGIPPNRRDQPQP
jgi:predicted nuclease of predicted toxin-antitoxin system